MTVFNKTITVHSAETVTVSKHRVKPSLISVIWGSLLAWNSSDNLGWTVSNGGLTASVTPGAHSIRGTVAQQSGKWYFEVTTDDFGFDGSRVAVGIASAGYSLGGELGLHDAESAGYGYYDGSGVIQYDGGTQVFVADVPNSGNVTGVAVDISNHLIWFALDGTWQNGGNPVAGTGGLDYVYTGPVYPALYSNATSIQTINAVQLYAPAGFSQWNQPSNRLTLTAKAGKAYIISIAQAQNEILRNTVRHIVNSTIGQLITLTTPVSRLKSIAVAIAQSVTTGRLKAFGKLIPKISTGQTASLLRTTGQVMNTATGQAINMFRAVGKVVNVATGITAASVRIFKHIVNLTSPQHLTATAVKTFIKPIPLAISSGVTMVRQVGKVVYDGMGQSVGIVRSSGKRITLAIGQAVTRSSVNIRSGVIHISQSQSVRASVAYAKILRVAVSSLWSTIRRIIRAASGATEPALIRSGNNVFLVTVTGHDGSTVSTLRFSTEGLMTIPSDTPASTYYEPRVVDPGNFERHLRARGVQDGSVGTGDVLLASGKPGRNSTTLDYLLDWAFDGYTITIQSLTSIRQTVALATTLFVGTIEQLITNDAYNKIGFKIHDRLSDIDQPFLTNTYAGTTVTGGDGTADGNTDLKGKKKQRLYGTCYGVTPQQSNPFDLVLDFNDGPVSSITMYDGALALTNDGDTASLAALLAWTQVPGHYKTCLALGKARAGTAAVFGWTADVVEVNSSPAGMRTAAQILLRMFDDFGITSGEIESSTFTALDAANSAECGILVQDDETFLSAAARLLDGPGAAVLPTRAGKFGVWYFSEPTTSPDGAVVELEEDTIIGSSLQRIATDSTGRGIPVYRVTMRYAKNNTVLSTTQIAGAVSDAQRAFVSTDFRSTLSQDTSVLTRHLKAIEVTFDTCFVSATDAANEAARHLALFSVRRDAYRVKAMLDYADAADIGTVVSLKAPRFGLDAGQRFIVIGRVDDYQNKTVDLDLWG